MSGCPKVYVTCCKPLTYTLSLPSKYVCDHSQASSCVISDCLCVCLQPVNTFVITARECSRALTDIRNREQPGIRSKFKGKMDEWHVEYRVTLLRVASWWALKWVSLSLA